MGSKVGLEKCKVFEMVEVRKTLPGMGAGTT